ncbi:MAG TPA: ubiquinol-cytochrome c reductase iron-sulfur subunit [Candidatus Brocadiia bacterium]|nr:Rieske 2Fe-2S domain-containing protein [Planctomycetota bacterium]MDO8094380.1 Rieske 2Fe-2S domain-containing protein [Candidatus Brocadiales bacterium]
MAEEVSQTTVVQKKEFADQPSELILDRRRVLRWIGWGWMWLFITAVFGSAARFFFPRVLFEPPTKLKVGYPSDYTIGTVSEKYMQKYRIWVVREVDRLYVIEAKCTHLGCTPFWLSSEKKFKCPCHGGGYTPEGVNIEGPPPRPLERFKVTLTEEGEILVDQAVRFRGERGEWEKPGAYISV